jgi:uncharacterized phage protein gp47/JayE
MADFGVTPEGFVLKTLNDILDEETSDLSVIQDPVTGEFLQPDFNSDDPTMQIVLVTAEQNSICWEDIQTAYDQFNPSNATGATLSSLVQINGIERQGATASTATVTCTGTAGITIPAGQTISDELEENTWTLPFAFTFDISGESITFAQCDTTGPITAASGTLTNIVTPPPSGWNTVTNAVDAIPGRDEESDSSLRRRRDISTLAPAASPPDALYSNLINTEDVEFARVYINYTLVTDANGIPPKSTSCVVVGGTDENVAMTIISRAGDCTEFYGTTTYNFTDAQGFIYPVSWFRPTEIEIYVIVNTIVTDTTEFPTDGQDQIAQAIVNYALGGAPALGITDGFEPTGFNPGVEIIQSRLFTPVNFVPGHDVQDIFIGIAPAPTLSANIPVAFNEIGTFDVSRITVNLV